MKQFAVIGLGRFGASVLQHLHALGHDVLAIDNDEKKVREMSAAATHVVCADAADEEAMRALGLRNFDVAVVSIGQDIEVSVIATLILKELGVRYVVAKAQNDLHGKILSKVGADRVIFPERDMGARVAHNLISSSVLDYIELSPEYSIIEIVATAEMVDNNLRQLEFRQKYGVNVLAIKRGDKIIVPPQADDRIAANDVIVVVGRNESIRRLEKRRLK